MPVVHLACSLLAEGTSKASWRSATQRSNAALVDTKPALLSLAALSPMGCGGGEKTCYRCCGCYERC